MVDSESINIAKSVKTFFKKILNIVDNIITDKYRICNDEDPYWLNDQINCLIKKN